MGSDPKKSVLNKHNQSWDVKNVFVTDGASFVSQGCQNPTLTMMALTVRACDYIVEQTKKGELQAQAEREKLRGDDRSRSLIPDP